MHQTRGHQLKLYKKPAQLQLRAAQRVVNEWNCLSSDIALAPTVSLFKQKLDILKEKGCGYEQTPGA